MTQNKNCNVVTRLFTAGLLGLIVTLGCCTNLCYAQYYSGQDMPFQSRLRYAQSGDSGAQYDVGCCYYDGKDVVRDYNEAARWFRRATEQGNGYAQHMLGICYYYGNGVDQDYTKAVRWFHAAATHTGCASIVSEIGGVYHYGRGHRVAQYYLGECYYNGQGVKQDYAEAANWYQLSAEQHYSTGQARLGDCYYYGHGVEQNYAKAIIWYQMSANQGDSYGQFCLGNYYYNKKDYVQALKWFRKAAEQGDSDAQSMVNRLEEMLY